VASQADALAALEECGLRIGIFVSEAWGPSSTIDEIRHRARRAEALGYPTGWVPYLPWSLDSLAAMQAAGEATERIEIGSAVIPTYFFHPLALARQAATTQAAIGRPIHLGIGCSNPAVIAMHGLAFEKPARHVREYLEILAPAMDLGAKPLGDREQAGFLQYEGEFFALGSIYGTPGAAPPGSILVGALGPHMLRVAGAHSDGVLATWSDEGAIEREIGPAVRAAAEAAGRPDPIIGGVVAVAVVPAARTSAARDAAQAEFAFYETTMPYQRVVEASNAGRIGDICVIGDEEEVARRLRGFRDAGMTDFLAAPFSVEGADWNSTAEKLSQIDIG
jgi:5,10-methylenetetrahydromethanopterin reductase